MFFITNLILFLDVIFLASMTGDGRIALIFLCFLLSVFSIQSLFLYLINKIIRKKVLLLLQVIFFTGNLIYIKVLNYQLFDVLTFYKKLFLLIILFIGTYVAMEQNKITKIKIISIMCLMNISLIISFIIGNNFQQEKINKNDIEQINFKQTPNVYLIGIDSLQSKKILEKKFNEKINTYENLKNITNTYINSFSSKNPTWQSWVDILSIGSKSYKADFSSIRGINDSSLLINIFKKNGYEIHSGFTSSSQGKTSGRYVDSFKLFNKNINDSSICWNDYSFLKIDKFYGFCKLSSMFIKTSNKYIKESDYIISEIKSNLELSKNPKLFLYHSSSMTIHWTKAAKLNLQTHNGIKYKNKILNGMQLIEDFIFNIHSYILLNDPHAIVIVFGDHGMFIDGKIIDKDNISKENIIDRIAIQTLSLKTKNTCIPNQEDNLLKEYSTTARLIATVINCLSSGDNPYFNNDDFDENLSLFNFSEEYLNFGKERKLKEFIYE